MSVLPALVDAHPNLSRLRFSHAQESHGQSVLQLNFNRVDSDKQHLFVTVGGAQARRALYTDSAAPTLALTLACTGDGV